MPNMTLTPLQRLEAKIDRSNPEGCHPWTGGLGQKGIPSFYLNKNRMGSARRPFWELRTGTVLTKRQWVTTTCGNPVCMNLEHLALRDLDPAVRFWSYVDKSAGDDGCWLWTGGVHRGNYGSFRPTGEKTVRAHRYAYELTHGPIPAVNADGVEVVVCHRCDVPLCVNPTHMFLGTDKDNHDDCVAKGAPCSWSEAGHRYPGCACTKRSNG